MKSELDKIVSLGMSSTFPIEQCYYLYGMIREDAEEILPNETNYFPFILKYG